MSAVGGVLYFGHRDCEVELLAVLDERLAHLGPDGGRVLRRDSVGFVHRAFQTTPEARHEQQPYEIDGLIVCLDGRLDNRVDLGAGLGRRHVDAPDIALIAACYRKWGTECFSRIHGDFSIVIWDARDGALILARAPFGIRRLFWHLDRHRMLWASTPDALLDLPGVADDLDDRYIGDFLTLVPEKSHSAFKAITPIVPGQGLIVRRNGSATMFTHWDVRKVPAQADGDRRPDTGSAAEQFRALLTDAVRVRLRADHPVLSELSGGLDSSSIVCLADALARESGEALPQITTLSHIYDQGKKGEDGFFIRIVEQHRNRVGLHYTVDDDPVLGPWPDADFLAFPRRFLCSGGATAKGHVILRAGARVVLSGALGDELLSQQLAPRDAARLVRHGRWLRAFRLCREYGQRLQTPALTLFAAHAIRPNVPLALRRLERPIPHWIDKEFARRLDLNARVKVRLEGRLSSSLAISRFRNPDLLLGLDFLATDNLTAPIRTVCVEMRYPYAHRPLVEFVLARPGAEIYGAAEMRWLQRTALVGVLPEAIRTRTGKGGLDRELAAAVDRE